MKTPLRNIIIAVAIGATSLYLGAFDLPVKRIGGIDYYYYTVERNEKIADVAKKFGVTRDDIIRNNPKAEDGLKYGMELYFPVHEFPEDNESLPGQSSSRAGVDAPTRYKVHKGETLYGIARRFDVTPDDIVALNPHAVSGVKAGQILLIPHSVADVNAAHPASNPPTVPRVIPPDPEPQVEPEPETTEPQENAMPDPDERRLRPVNPTIVVIADSTEAEVDSVPEIEVSTISLMLPLMLNEQGDNKQARLSADFIRGFMLGAKSMSHDSYPCDINVFDTQANPSRIAEILSDSAVIMSNIIIAHEEGPAGATLPEFADRNENYILNLFASHDTTYLVNPHFLQANIPAHLMYEKASQALFSAFDGYTPVFLAAKGGRGEKVPFTTYLQERYSEKGIDPIELVYEGMLTSADIENFDLSKKYVFIPASGSLSEFNKFAHTLVSLRDAVDDQSAIALFGYPDWTTFRGESLELLHSLEAMIYSRFYCDENDVKTRGFIQQFEAAYGSRPLEQVPSQAILGYDTARFILSNIKNNDGDFTPVEVVPYRGIQSTFMFADAASDESDSEDESEDEGDIEAGYVNTSLYIIRYMPGQLTSVQVL